MNKLIRKIEKGLQTDVGQRFLQYAYSFGAAIVIFGAMVKVLHWWGIWGNIIFGTGMVIECIVFILYGLDRPEATPQLPTLHSTGRVGSTLHSRHRPCESAHTRCRGYGTVCPGN